jgi:hypothetical protein
MTEHTGIESEVKKGAVHGKGRKPRFERRKEAKHHDTHRVFGID